MLASELRLGSAEVTPCLSVWDVGALSLFKDEARKVVSPFVDAAHDAVYFNCPDIDHTSDASSKFRIDTITFNSLTQRKMYGPS